MTGIIDQMRETFAARDEYLRLLGEAGAASSASRAAAGA